MVTTLRGLTIAITGTLRKMTRARAFELIRMEAAYPTTNVNGRTDILVIADDSIYSTKAKNAERCGTRLMTESDFYLLIGA